MLIIFWFLTAMTPQGDIAADDVARAFDRLTERLQTLVRAYNRGDEAIDADLLQVDLINVERAVRQRAEISVDRNTTRTLTLAAKNRALFSTVPSLPAEVKRGGRWAFKPVRFDVVPEKLYVFSVRCSADVTVRIRAIRLHFRDGTSRLDNRWWTIDNNNGQAFAKDTPWPAVAVFGDNEPRQAKALAAVEIIGSAQDGPRAAQLRFTLEIPDPAANPAQDTLALIARIKRNWNDQTVSANRLNQCLLDAREIAAALNIPFCFDTVAVD